MEKVLEKEENQAFVTNSSYKTDLSGIRKSISPHLYKSNFLKAMLYMGVAIGFYIFCLTILSVTFAYNLWYLYPFAWFIGGTGVTSMFVLGHDCAHSSFFKSNRWNDFWGHIALLVPLYPYYGWKYSHNAHHKQTNLLEMNPKDIYYDNAWIPLTVRQYKALNRMRPSKARTYRMGRMFPPFGAFMHNILTHFYPEKFNESQRKKVILSYITLGSSMLMISSIIYILTHSIFAIFHFYILPALFFSFWMSLYTYQHHTSTEMDFYNKEEWNSYKGQILSTFNSLSPKWFSLLHLNIDIHTPHHLSTAIPSYHLREAYNELKKSEYSEDIQEGKINFSYYFSQIKNCHIWDEKKNQYIKFSDI
jgi:acyl-lipid omega-6 desaturase (Delta-12 desaturase)